MYHTLQLVADGLRYACAGIIVLVVCSTTLFASYSTRSRAQHHEIDIAYIFAGQVILIITYVAEAFAVAFYGIDFFATSQARLAHLVSAGLTWSILTSQKSTTVLTLYTTNAATLLFEIPLVVVSNLHNTWSFPDTSTFSIEIVRIVLLMVIGYLAFFRSQPAPNQEGCEPLLANQEHTDGGYDGITGLEHPKNAFAADNPKDDDSDDEDEDEEDVAMIKQRRAELLKERGGWLGYLRDFKIFAPYIIPKYDRTVQLCYLASIICLIAGRALNVMLPAQLGKVADNLTNREPPYQALAIWLLLSFARYQPGLDLVQSLVKIPIENFSYRGLTNAAFSHVMSLSMDFHSERDSAEVIRAIEQGNAITTLLTTLVLEILPTILDLVIAFVYLARKFNQIVALALLASTAAFVGAELIATSWNIGNRRAMAKATRQEAKIILQAVQGWSTVSFFNMFNYERHRFGQAVQTSISAKQSWSIGDALVQAVVEALFPATFFVLACLVMHEISLGRATPGDFVFLMQYWDHLTWPISMLSHNCRYVMSDLVDAERLLHLLQIEPSIKSSEDAINIDVQGQVEFDNVHFSYDSKQPVLHDISLKVVPGQTVALVGETGAGKSSIMRLLLRLYDISSGHVLIDNHDIRALTLDCLRSSIGVVPQAPLLFNGTILENLRYARLTATDAEIESACRAAAIHDKITTFASGYATIVGEQGVKLSGGEIQRLAIARVFLKNPPILILDEATSAVDSLTEAAVQTALDRLRAGRTTLVVAHRLSTIVGADEILVVHNGGIVEQWRHEELLAREGRYWRMWSSQTGKCAT